MFDRLRRRLEAHVARQTAPPAPARDPGRSAAHKAEGDALLAAGEATRACQAFGAAVASDPGNADAFIAFGHALWRLGRNDEAIARLESALAIEDRSADAHYLLALVLQDAGDVPGAIVHFERLIELFPEIGDAYVPLFKAYLRAGQSEAARTLAEKGLTWYRRAVASDPGNADLLNNCGVALRELGLADEALDVLGKALQVRPAFAEALNNRGLILSELDRFEQAMADYDRALQINDTLADVHVNRGHALRELLRHEDALAAYGRAQASAPREDLFVNESLTQLVLGDMPAGWQKFESRWQAVGRTHPREQFAMPLWLGEQPLAGKTIFLYAEQGLGDTIQLCRYAKCVSDRGAKVVLGVQRSLVPILEGLEGVDWLIALGPNEPVPAVDYHCPLLSLPLAFGTSLQTIPRPGAYLRPSGPDHPVQLDAWQARLGARDRPRIGVVWSGNADHKNDRNRSIPLADFIAIVSDRARFIALQNDVRPEDAVVLKAHPQLEYVGPELVDFGQTAALVAQLDLVISVDTSVAHLAAAMGKPVWLLLPFNPDWRWLLDRDDSPWYETVRLFRQPHRGDWSGVLARVGREIEGFAKAAAES